MTWVKYKLALFFWSVSLCIFGQKYEDADRLIADIIEYIESTSEVQQDYTMLYESIACRLRHPVNINTADDETLRSLYLLNEFQIRSLRDYINRYGPILSAGELELIYGFDLSLAEHLMHLVSFSDDSRRPFTLSDVLDHGDNQLILRSSSSGLRADELTYPDNMRLITRYRYESRNHLFAGFTTEKDPHERTAHAMDFFSGYVQIKDIRRLKSAVLGDFQASYGQGLVLWSGSAFRQPFNGMGSAPGSGLNRYSSTDENRFFRGAATSVVMGKTEWMICVSRKKIDATVALRDTSDDQILSVSSLQQSGLHYTPSQIEGKDALGETAMAGSFIYRTHKGEAGVTMLNVHYDVPLFPQDEGYKKYSFRGDHARIVGIHYRQTLPGGILFGESAIDQSHHIANIHGITLFPISRILLNVVYHHYGPGYYSPYQNAFSATSELSGQKGFCLGSVIRVMRTISISGYTYLYSFTWLRYGVDAPSDGRDVFLRTDIKASRAVAMHVQYRNRTRQENSGLADMFTERLYPVSTNRIRYHIDYSVTEQLSFRSRIEYSIYSKYNRSAGIQLSQDTEYDFKRPALTAFFRLLTFRVDEYDARIYTYERDVLYSWSVPSYTGSGLRYCMMFRLTLHRHHDLWIRAGFTDYLQSPGQPAGNPSSADISVQTRWLF